MSSGGPGQAAPVSEGEKMSMENAMKAWQQWKERRHDELAGPESWFGLTGLYWLEHGVNTVGSAEDAAVRLPAGPERLGVLRWEADGHAFWQPDDGPLVELHSDREGLPTVVDWQNMSFFLVDRDNRLAVRVRDRDWASRSPFPGLDYFPFDPAWQINAAWQSFSAPRVMEVPNVSGEMKTVSVTHHAVFEIDGQVVNLLPMSISEKDIFFVFRDLSSGKETYGAGRFLRVPASLVKEGRIVLDFNRAFNPPCAFTPFATCPLPPPENWLQLRINAGEMKPSASHGKVIALS